MGYANLEHRAGDQSPAARGAAALDPAAGQLRMAEWLGALASECGFDRQPLLLKRNRKVYRSGEWDGALYLVRAGVVAILVDGPGARKCITDLLGAGDVLGELALGRRGPREESAVVLRDAQLIRIPVGAIFPRLSDPELCATVLRYFEQRMVAACAHVTMLLSCHAEQRLALTLLRLAHCEPPPSGQPLRIVPLTQQELANTIGTTRNRVCTFLSGFRESGWIENGDRGVRVIDAGALTRFAMAAQGAQRAAGEAMDGP